LSQRKGSLEEEAEIELMETIVELLKRSGVRCPKRAAVEETSRPQGDVSGGGRGKACGNEEKE
jgi:hypothetical protein